jgi:diguanylate cyclase (GGDEF)-like protein
MTPIASAAGSVSAQHSARAGDEVGYAACARETHAALERLLALVSAACGASAMALLVVDGDVERSVATFGIANYAVAKCRGLSAHIDDCTEAITLAGEEIRTAGFELPFPEAWQQWKWRIRRLHSSWCNQAPVLWMARGSERPFAKEDLDRFEQCALLAQRELAFLGRHKDIVVQRERATIEIAEFHQQLHEQHLLYRELAKHLPGTAVLIFDVDLQVRIREGWQALALPSQESDSYLGQHVAECFPLQEAGRIDAACRHAIQGDRDTIELRFEDHYYELSAGPLPDPTGMVTFGILVTRDVTDDRNERVQSLATATRLQALVESLDDGILVEDENRVVQLCSNRLREVMKLDPSGGSYINQDGRELSRQMASICFIPEAFEESTENLIEKRISQRNEIIFLADMRIAERDYVPLSVCGQPIGHLWVYQDVTQREQAKDLLQRQADELRALSLVDELTGLYNRRGFLTMATQQLKLCDRSLRPALVAFVDLDGMKRINDELGHDFGDQALVETSSILRHCFRSSDLIARLGGDEFVALAIDAPQETCSTIEKRLYDRLAVINAEPNRAFELQFSVGMSPYDPARAEMIEEVLARADALMYEQKRARNAVRKT